MTWKSHKTFAATLKTYLQHNLFDYFDEVLVLFQEMSEADRVLAERYALKYISTEQNIGIYGGMKMLAETAQNDTILLLENDCILVEPEDVIETELARAFGRLISGEVNVYRLRHRWRPGEKFDTVRKFKKYHRPEKVLDRFISFFCFLKRKRLIGTAPYVLESIFQSKYLKYIQPQVEGDYILDSSVLPWTNQSVMCSKSWLLNQILPYVAKHPSRRTLNGFQDVERALNRRWWRSQHFKIGLGLGLFSHERLDF